MVDEMTEIPVLIAGGGPVGMMLARELSHRGIRCMVAERNATTTRHPKMDITNGRTMEHFRRLGMVDAMREAAVPTSHVFDVSWITDLAGHELARFSYPNVDQAREIIRYVNDGSQPLEPDMRVSQIILEPVLKKFLDEDPLVDVRFGWAFVSFEETEDEVIGLLRNTETDEEEYVRCQYLAGCDGGNSKVRRQLGIELSGMPDVATMYMVHFKSEALDVLQRWGVAWHYQSAKGTLIAQNDKDIWTLHVPLPEGAKKDDIDPNALVRDFAGTDFDFEVLVHNAWSPQLLLADSYGGGRVYLAGDAAHQYVPTGGYGMNTGMGDAVDLGWKLAAMLLGWGGSNLLASYEGERRHVGERNRQGSERHVGVRFEIAMAYLEGTDGEAERQRAGRKILELGNAENEALGIEIGYRYETSPIVCLEEGKAPPYDPIIYQPTTWPGARLPSVFLEDGRAVFDLLGEGYTLIAFGGGDISSWTKAAAKRNVPLDLLQLSEAAIRAVYGCDYLLIRPDQHVCWRGDVLPNDPGGILERVTGR
jgi:2-polyprenyl-6-methoxyphenol hydroxylase-like FAD-dependent oxidoreductase